MGTSILRPRGKAREDPSVWPPPYSRPIRPWLKPSRFPIALRVRSKLLGQALPAFSASLVPSLSHPCPITGPDTVVCPYVACAHDYLHHWPLHILFLVELTISPPPSSAPPCLLSHPSSPFASRKEEAHFPLDTRQ